MVLQEELGPGRATQAIVEPRQANTLHLVSGPGDEDWRSPDESYVTVREDAGQVVMVLAGELDVATTPALWTTLDRLVGQGHLVVTADLANVTFADCSLLTFLVVARRRLTAVGGSFSVTGESRLLSRMFEVTGLTELLVVG